MQQSKQQQILQQGFLNGEFMRAFNAEYRARRQAGETRLSYRAAKQRFQRLMLRRLSRGEPSAGVIDMALSR